MLITEKMQRIPNKIKRKFLQFPVVKLVSDIAYNKELEKYANCLAEISPLDSTLVKSLCQEGVFVTSLQALEIPSTSLTIASSEKLLPELLALPSHGKSSISLPFFQLMNYPEIFLWGLEERLLDIIENYIGLPVLYHGVDFRREIADGKPVDVRQWHIDVEDHRMVKIIIYLNDVSLNSGPFEYISKPSTSLLRQTLQYSSGFVSDEVIKTHVPVSDWKSCTGNFGTVTLCDTCNIFHRAKAPIATDRFSMTFAYTSRRPIKIYSKALFSKNDLLRISNRLSQRQKECIVGYKKQ